MTEDWVNELGLLKSFYLNTRKPKGVGGRLMLSLMNAGHNPNALWGLSYADIAPDAAVLDIGCGGGRNIRNLLSRAPKGHVTGVDYSPESVEKSKRVNKAAIRERCAQVRQADVSTLPFADGSFDLATAFETVYFWPDPRRNFAEVRRVLKPGGLFLICNEAARPEHFEKWIDMLSMKVYTGEELSAFLRDAGFADIACHLHPNGKWLCVAARKAADKETD